MFIEPLKLAAQAAKVERDICIKLLQDLADLRARECANQGKDSARWDTEWLAYMIAVQRLKRRDREVEAQLTQPRKSDVQSG